MSAHNGRLGEPCRFCGSPFIRRDGASVVCETGHWVVDADAPPSQGIHWIGKAYEGTKRGERT